MDIALAKYYEERLSMMGSVAWKQLMEDVQTMLNATNDISGIPDEKTLHYRRGEIAMMRWMLSLKTVSEETYEDLKNAPTL